MTAYLASSPIHSCGHPTDRAIRDTPRGRAYAATITGKECPDCYRQRANAEAQRMAADLKLPDLSGSDAQVRWAGAIRETWRQRVPSYLTGADVPTLAAVDAALYGIRSASWWIDRRKWEPAEVLAELAPVCEVVIREYAA